MSELIARIGANRNAPSARPTINEPIIAADAPAPFIRSIERFRTGGDPSHSGIRRPRFSVRRRRFACTTRTPARSNTTAPTATVQPPSMSSAADAPARTATPATTTTDFHTGDSSGCSHCMSTGRIGGRSLIVRPSHTGWSISTTLAWTSTPPRLSMPVDQVPLTLRICRNSCSTSTRSTASAITTSMSLYASGISSTNSSPSRNSMPVIRFRRSSTE